MNIRDSVYLVSTIFQTVLIYKFITAFLGNEIKSGVIKYALYIGYYLVISFVYLFVRVPSVIITSNIFMLIVLTLNYEETIKRKSLSVIFIYAASILSEAISLASLRILNIVREPFPFTDNEFIISRITALILLYPLVLLYSNRSFSKNKGEAPPIFWFVAIFVPFATLVPSLLILFDPQANYWAMLLTTAMVFFLNFLIFYFYGELISLYQNKIEKEIYQVQLKAYSNQFNLLENQANTMKTFKHDIINHLISLSSFLDNSDVESAVSYLKEMHQIILSKDEYVKISNPAISSIMNYRIGEAHRLDINVKHDISTPDILNVSTVDLTAIIGNLFDNAIEALTQIEGDREIIFSFTYENGLINIAMENEFLGDILFNGEEILTTKSNKSEHGLGLLSVRNSVIRYNGVMEVTTNSNTFRVDIMMYNKKPH